MSNSTLALEVIGIHKSYGKVRAVNGVTFKVKQGEVYGLIGPNGAGKTTTLKIIVGLLRPDKGTVRIYGYDIIRQREKALRLIGYIPENPSVFQYLTVQEFLEFIGSVRGIDRRELNETIDYYLELFNIHNKRTTLLGSLSRGMLQKVLATAAFIVKPKLLVMDEPMAGMDPESQYVFKKEVTRMVKEERVAAVISSHLLYLVEQLCNRLGIIHKGKIIVEGTINQIKKTLEQKTLEEVYLKIINE